MAATFTTLPYRDRLVHALTEWDRNQSGRKGHNPYFIGIALESLERAENVNENPREAIFNRFNGRLVPFLLDRLGLEPLTESELRRIR